MTYVRLCCIEFITFQMYSIEAIDDAIMLKRQLTEGVVYIPPEYSVALIE